MPIKGLTDRGLSFAEIGSIRKGAAMQKDASGKMIGFPKDLPYFRVEFDSKEKDRADKFVSIYGAQPIDINILLPFNEIGRVWDAWYEAYTAGRMVARSDGEYFTYWIDVSTGQVKVIGGEPVTAHQEIVGEYTNGKGKTEQIKMNPVGRLKVVIPELQSVAYLTVHTGSIHDIINLSSQLEGIKAINGGCLAGVPLVLRRRPKKISIPKPDGSRVRLEKWMLSIEADPKWVAAKLDQMQAFAFPNGQALLPDGRGMITLPTQTNGVAETEMPEDNADPTEVLEGEFDTVNTDPSPEIEEIPAIILEAQAYEVTRSDGKKIAMGLLTIEQLSKIIGHYRSKPGVSEIEQHIIEMADALVDYKKAHN